MLIKTLTLQDVGQYGGEHVFDLVPRGKNRPIVLFGGHNGSGKTTILNSISLCLYGRNVLGDRVKPETYHRFLWKTIHRATTNLLPTLSAKIQVVFEHVVMGETEVFEVTRKWSTVTNEPNGIVETLEIQKCVEQPDQTIKKVPLEDKEQWEGFLRGLLPMGLTQLFFFDGEKIHRLAEDDDNEELSASVRNLIGLDLVARLETDLRVYLNRELASLGDTETQSAVRSLEQEIELLEQRKRETHRDSMDFQAAHLDPCAREIEAAELKLQTDGRELAEALKKNVSEQEAVKLKLQTDQDQIKELAKGVLPFAMCAALSRNLRDVLRSTDEVASELKNILDRFVSGELDGAADIPQRDRLITDRILRQAVMRDSDASGSLAPDTRATVLGELSDSDRKWALEVLSGALDHVPTKAAELRTSLDATLQQQDRFEAQAAIVPDEEALRPQVEQLKQLGEQLGSLKQEKKTRDAVIVNYGTKLETVKRQYARRLEEIDRTEETTARIEKVKAAQRALVQYRKEATTLKIEQLEKELATCFGQLCQKSDLVERVSIDHSTFAITLHGKRDKVVPKEDLSEGEKQILGISILWALGRTSGRPLPVMIDTPLARLDDKHRHLLVERYFPHASHQVIIFSTDTEVDEPLLTRIGPNVSHAFHLRYDEPTQRTVSRSGYFWKYAESEAADHPAEAVV